MMLGLLLPCVDLTTRLLLLDNKNDESLNEKDVLIERQVGFTLHPIVLAVSVEALRFFDVHLLAKSIFPA
jgi:hypothetical protein